MAADLDLGLEPTAYYSNRSVRNLGTGTTTSGSSTQSLTPELT